jgi:streptogramin lyase
MKRALAGSICASALLAACSSGGQTIPMTAQSSAQMPDLHSATEAAVTFTVVVPAGSRTGASRRRPQYISPSTRSVVVALDGKTLATFNVGPSSRACKTGANGARTCTARSSAPAGHQTFDVAAFDGIGGNGNELASGSVSATLQGGASQSVGISLDGIPVTVAVSLRSPYPPAGSPKTTPVDVALLDADGNTIVGAYGSSVTLADSDKSGATTLSTTTIVRSSQPVMLTYDGGTLARADISATLAGVRGGKATFAPSPFTTEQYVAPVVQDGTQVLPMGISDLCVGPDGNIWGTGTSAGAIEKIDPKTGTFTSYLVLSSGPAAITVGSDHNMWFAETQSGAIGKVTTNGKITSYKLPFPSGGSSQPGWTTLGPDGRIWFVEQGYENVKVGAIATNGKITEYPLPANSFPQEIVTGPDGNLWITDGGLNGLLRVSPSGKVLAVHTLPTASAQPWGITVGPDKNIWFTEYTANAIGRMTISGALKEVTVPTPNAGPINLAAGPDGNVWFTETGAFFWNILGKVGYVSMDESVIRDFPGGSTQAHVHNLMFDKSGALWYTKFDYSYSALDKLVY